MQVTIEQKPQSVAAITVELGADEFERYYDEALAELAKGLTEDGFRPGHVPAAVAASRVGERRILEEASRLALTRTYPDIIEEKGFEPLGAPQAEVLKVARQNPFVYRVEVPVAPRVVLPDWRAIAGSAPHEPVVVDDAAVQQALGYLQRSRATLTPVDRPAQQGDQLEVDVTIQGGERKHHSVIVGEHRFMPGFEEALVGLQSGEQKTFSLRVPDTFGQPVIAGKNVAFQVMVRRIDERVIPDLTDEFARTLGKFTPLERRRLCRRSRIEIADGSAMLPSAGRGAPVLTGFTDLAALRDGVRMGLQTEACAVARDRRREHVLAAIAAQTKVEVPDRLVESEVERIMHDFSRTLEHTGANLTDYLAHLGKTDAAFRDGLRPAAAERAKHSLIIRAIAKAADVSVSDAEVDDRSRRLLAQLPSDKEAESAVDPQDLAAYTRGVLRTEKVLELLDAA